MERLDTLKDEDALPPSTVDIGRAIRSGRRRVRARWAGASAVITAAVLVGPALVISALGTGGPAGGSVGHDPAASRPAERSEPPSAPHPGFDPARRVITLGEVPGVAPESYTTARYWQTMQLQTRSARPTVVHLVVYAPDREVTFGAGTVVRPDSGEPAEPIGGRSAYWLADGPYGGGPTLAWQWADNAWSFVGVDDRISDQHTVETLRRIALAVRIGPGEPVTVPFTMPRPGTPSANPALPADYRLLGTTAQLREPGNPFVRTGLMFGTDDQADPGRQASNEGGVMVSVENGSKMAQALGADRTIDGHRAVASQGLLIMFGFTGGFAVEVQGAGGEDALLAAARAVQFVTNPDDRSTWTDQPLR